MFAITTKAKIAAGIAAGALTLGAAGAYAAQNLPQTLTTPTISTLGTGTNQVKLVSLNGAAAITSLPASATKDPGACVSYFATNKNYALVPQGYTSGSITISKPNFHGKLMAAIHSYCATFRPTSGTSDATQTETPDASQSSAPSTDSTDSAAPQAGTHGHGHGHGHGFSAQD